MKKFALEEFGLELVEKKNLVEFYQENIGLDKQGLFERMVGKDLHDKLTEEDIQQQWEICQLYLVFAFRKVGAPVKR